MEVFDRAIASIIDFGAINWIAVCSVLAAFFAAVEARRNRRIASRMYDIAVHEKFRTETPLDVYLACALIPHVPKKNGRFHVFKLLITNSSVAPNSIKQLLLTFDYDQGNQPTSSLAIQHDPNALDPSTTGQVGNALCFSVAGCGVCK